MRVVYEKEFILDGTVGGYRICNKCYPIWWKGVSCERTKWENWTGKQFLEMYHLNEK